MERNMFGIAIRKRGFSGNSYLPFISLVRFGVRKNFYDNKYVFYTSRCYWRWDKVHKGVYWSWESSDIPNWVSSIFSFSGAFKLKTVRKSDFEVNLC